MPQLAALLRSVGEEPAETAVLPGADTSAAGATPPAAHAVSAVPADIQALALRSLAIQLMDRSRHPAVVAAVASGGQSGLLAALLHRAVASLGAPAGSGQAGEKEEGRIQFVEALLSLVGALVASTTGARVESFQLHYFLCS